MAVIGDGAMTAGMAFEALMHAGGMEPEPNLLVILNDNNMSISEAVGLTKMLGRATGSRTLNALREGGKKILGDKKNNPARFVKRWEEHWKGMFVPSTMFEEMGFHYTGPIDGHDMPALLSTLKTLRASKGPKLLHVMTTKGKGYEPAEGDQIGYHAVGPFDPDKGLVAKAGAKKPTYTDVFSDWLCDAAAAEPRLYGITPAMREGSGLVRFSKGIPAALLRGHCRTARGHPRRRHGDPGGKPVVAIYSTFLQRAYDQLVHDVAIQDLDVLFAIDRAGVVGPDGATHAGNLDLSFLRCVPNMVVMALQRSRMPADAQHRPAAPRPGSRALSAWHRHRRGCRHRPVHPADRQGELRLQGSRIALLAFGSTVAAAEQVGRELGLSVVNMRFIKPLDRELLLAVAAQHEGLVTIEDNVVAGGAGSGVGELLNAEGVLRHPAPGPARQLPAPRQP